MSREGLPAHRRPERDPYRPQPSDEHPPGPTQRIVAAFATVPVYFRGDPGTNVVRVSFRYDLRTGEHGDVRVEPEA